MRIVRIEATTVHVELVKPYVTADYPGEGIAAKSCVLLRIFTDDGLVGLGETDPFPTFTYESPDTVMRMIRQHLGPAVLGMDPCNLAGLHAAMDAALPHWLFAKAPIDIAAYDPWGQALGVPVYQLLGGKLRDRVPLIWPIGGDSPAANADEARIKVEEGYRTLHIKVGALAPKVDIERVRAIRQAVGPDIPLMLDANQGWDRSTALDTVRRLQSSQPSIMEQPVQAWDTEGMARIQASADTPISGDEALRSLQDGMNLIRNDAARVFSLKHGKCGGLFRTRKLAAVAEAAGLTCFVNSMIEMDISVAASLHLAATIPNLVAHGHALMSNLRIKAGVLADGAFQYDGTDILIPEQCAGLGVKLDEEKLEGRIVDRFVLEI